MDAPPSRTGLPPLRTDLLRLAVSGHRSHNPSLEENRERIDTVLDRLFTTVAARCAGAELTVLSCDATGTDRMAQRAGRSAGWQVVHVLPVGPAVNERLNPDRLTALPGADKVFALADADAEIAGFVDGEGEGGVAAGMPTIAERAALAGEAMLQHCDALIAVWDGNAANAVGGTRHTVERALQLGRPVLWVDARTPDRWRLLERASDLGEPSVEGTDRVSEDALAGLLKLQLERWQRRRKADAAFERERVTRRTRQLFHLYRRIEALFGGEGRPFRSLRIGQAPVGEKPTIDAISALPGMEARFVEAIERDIGRRQAFVDAVATHRSDVYRGGMSANFLLSALAVIMGVAYLPLVGPEWKWPFALVEFVMLLTIVTLTTIGARREWHRRWFETRRVAEYLRHAPAMLAIGAMPGTHRLMQGRAQKWPEVYARTVTDDIGLPDVTVTPAFLRSYLGTVLRPYAKDQRLYHEGKSRRLAHVEDSMDRLSTWLFAAAVLSVGTYLLFELFGIASGVPAKAFTFLAVAFPTLGAAIAGMRYFGDFERFASISADAAVRLDRLEGDIEQALSPGAPMLSYRHCLDLAHRLDGIVHEELSGWQSVFGIKRMSIPV